MLNKIFATTSFTSTSPLLLLPAACPCYPAQVVNLFKLSDGDSIHIREPLPLEPSPEGDIFVDIPNKARITI